MIQLKTILYCLFVNGCRLSSCFALRDSGLKKGSGYSTGSSLRKNVLKLDCVFNHCDDMICHARCISIVSHFLTILQRLSVV